MNRSPAWQNTLQVPMRKACQPRQTTPSTQASTYRVKWMLILLLMLMLLCNQTNLAYVMLFWSIAPDLFKGTAMMSTEPCLQIEPLRPVHGSSDLSKMEDYLLSQSFRNESAHRLSGAIQIPTESFDDMGSVEDDERWNIFFSFAAYLEKQFPLISYDLQLERINTHGLLYTWQGKDQALRPTVLMAHQDVVPVVNSTRDQWTHDAFGGYYDGKYVWGRGSSDCKNSLIGIMEAVELLIQAGFKPTRTLILSFGFDEEISGERGANLLAKHLINRYHKTGGAAVIVDEGAGVYSQWDTNFAPLGVAEKGYMNVEITIRMPGGHSSIPPAHTGIGVAAELISAIEAQPYIPRLYPENPFLGLMQCAAVYSPSFPKELKKMLPKPGHPLPPEKGEKLAIAAGELLGPAVKYLFTTSQAVDIISGGVKVNALPERSQFVVNHRVNVGETTAQIRIQLSKIASKIAQKHNLTLHSFSTEKETPSSITLTTIQDALEPAPVTPTRVDSTTPYVVLSGTLRALYGDKMTVTPGIMTGNTDTKFYWKLSEHIFRYNPGWDPESEDPFKSIHTVDEKVSILNHVRTVQWYSLFVRNMDEASLE